MEAINYVLFPSDYFKADQIDLELQQEYNAAGQFDTVIFSFADWFEKGKLRLNKRFCEKVRAVYRGWMMKPEQYKQFYEELLCNNIELVTPPEAYAKLHIFPYIYNEVKGNTAKMLVFPLYKNIDVNTVKSCMERFMVKDYVKSVKGTEFPRFFDHSITQDEFNNYMELFYKYRGNLLTGGICIKEYLDLKKYGYWTNEYRVFYINNEIASVSRNSGQHRYTPQPPKELINKFKCLPSPFYTIDFAETESGEWKIIETGDGGVSGLSDYQDIDSFYRTLYLYLNLDGLDNILKKEMMVDMDLEEIKYIAFQYACTGTEQSVEFLTIWNGYHVFEFFGDNPWGNGGKGYRTRVHFVLVKDKVARFETEEELKILIEISPEIIRPM